MNDNPRNQFLDCGALILEVSAKTKKKSACITIAVPDDLATQIMKDLACGRQTKCKPSIIRGLQLSWLDTTKVTDPETLAAIADADYKLDNAIACAICGAATEDCDCKEGVIAVCRDCGETLQFGDEEICVQCLNEST